VAWHRLTPIIDQSYSSNLSRGFTPLICIGSGKGSGICLL
jgi:hypothetical protein